MPVNPFKLLDPSYLFNLRPGAEFFYFWPLFVLFVAIFVGSFWVKKKSIPTRMREFALLGLLLTFFRDQNIPYLGMRLWLLLFFLGALIYSVGYWKKAEQAAELKPLRDERREKLEKYLPKKKKR